MRHLNNAQIVTYYSRCLGAKFFLNLMKQKTGSNNIFKHINSEERTISQNDGNRIGKHTSNSLLEHLETLIQLKDQSNIGEQNNEFRIEDRRQNRKGRHAFLSNMFQAQ